VSLSADSSRTSTIVTESKDICGKSASSGDDDDFQSGEAMSHASVAADPSMDEILEKIQRTIATDGKEESTLEDSTRLSTEDPELEAGQDNAGREAPTAVLEQQEPLLAAATAGAAVAAFTQLAAIQRQRRRLTEFPMGGERRTLEDVMREMLTPMMRDFLDQKLPEILERLVKAELARALGQAEGA
jgi:cell pole-organizing protein PopZ